MKILSVIASFGSAGGAEMLVRKLSLAFARRGHECHIAYISAAEDLNASEEFELRFKEELDARGVTYELIGHEARRNWLLGAWRLRRIIRDFDADIVHIHLAYGLFFRMGSLANTPTIYTHHNIVTTFPPSLFRLFDLVVDEYVGICGPCEVMLRRHVKQPITRIDNGVPADFVRFSRTRTEVPRNVNLLSVGNLSPQKDYSTLIHAMVPLAAYFRSQGRHFRLRIAGEGAERELLERLIEKKNLGDFVELLGTRTDVPQLMRDSHLLLMSSRWEGLPMTLIEAAMAGLPVVATDVGGCSDIVLNGETGFLVPPGEADTLAEKAIQILTDDDLYAAFSARARELSGRYDMELTTDAHLALYSKVRSRRTQPMR